MLRQCIYLLLTIATVRALTETTEYTAVSEVPKSHPPEDRLLANIVRARNSSKVNKEKSNDSSEVDKNVDKKPRTVIHSAPNSEPRDNCCGPRHSSLHRPDPNYNRIPTESGRYPSQYGERVPVDRYGWQTQGRPSGSNGSGGSGGRPGTGSYGGNYGGTVHHGGNQAGDRFSSRPGYGSESSGRPGGYGSGTGGYSYGNAGYGSYGAGRPTGYGGGYGISGTLADGDDFEPGEPNYPEGNAPSHPNIQTQKAVALKALAGVALIGAAAALATNPVLLPIGLVAGRKKRSTLLIKAEEDSEVEDIIRILKNNLSKVYGNRAGNKIVLSPRCVARLTCEIQKDYLSDVRKDVELLKEFKSSEHRLTNLIRNNVLSVESLNGNVKKLIRIAASVASTGGDCSIFSCRYVKVG